MKRKHYIFLFLGLLCLAGTGSYAWVLYSEHCRQVKVWNEAATAAFEEALWMEANKRGEIPLFHSSSEQSGVKTLNPRIPDTVRIMTPGGFLKYKIERRKYDLCLIKETRRRMFLGALLDLYPLSIDTLSLHWDSLLRVRQIPAQSQIRYVYTDWELRNDTVNTSSGRKLLRSDSLTTRYLGFRCEHELVAYTSYPFWMFGLTPVDGCCLLLPWLVYALLLVFYIPLEAWFLRKFVREKVVEREVHVADVAIEKAKIFQLPDGSLLNSFDGILTKGEARHTLAPQSHILLKLFLRKENHRLSPAEIEQELWNGNGTNDKIHKAIQRLRNELKKVESEVTIKNVNGDYELKSPISS